MRHAPRRAALAALLTLAAGCDDDPAAVERTLAGGDLTVFERTSNGFSAPAPPLSDDELDRHLDGDVDFEAVFVSAPAPVNAGLGPIFNHNSCAGCHVRDGRGLAQAGLGPVLSPLLVRVSLPEGEPADPGGAVPVPGLGTQLQDHAVFGHTPEAHIAIRYEDVDGAYGDGEPYRLRRPILDITLADGSPLDPAVLTSARIPPPVFGLGLLEAVPEATLLARADPDDADGDGISGRPNRVWDPVARQTVLGRFSWKANTASLLLQTAGAYANDMGISSPIHPEADGTSDIDLATVERAAFYVQTLAVPAPAPMDATARAGERHFERFGCAQCHVPTLETGDDHPVAILRGQRIHPYTDLLLHDLGPELADGRPDFLADGQEWRTTPLWGLGLVETVLPGATYLHDGRARSLAEAILWHGGEAEEAREAFRTAPRAERDALIAFLRTR